MKNIQLQDPQTVKGSIKLEGPQTVKGSIKVSGAKNSILPIMCATLLTKESVVLDNVPNINDVFVLRDILSEIGRCSEFEKEIIKFPVFKEGKLDYNIPIYANKIRYSVLLLGALLATQKKVRLPLPGGCGFSERPIDIHLDGLSKLGAKIEINEEYIYAETEGLVGNDITLRFPSVGATENLIIASTLAKGTTYLRNVAREPEIEDLINFLNKLGANILFESSDTIKIEGVEVLNNQNVYHAIIPDRIETATYVILGAIASENELTIENINIEHNLAFFNLLQEIGVKFKFVNETNVTVYKHSQLKPINVQTGVYPKLATDIQPMLAVLLSLASGESEIIDTIYPTRYQYSKYLNMMNGNFKVLDGKLLIGGPTNYKGNNVYSTDLRGGAAVLLASIIAKGESTIENSYQIGRGYSDIINKLKNIGINLNTN
ncbi:UDP-N-acetylglucosamine 1-carboxyvinyltransferase [Bacillus alveayuensis]|uniref:UDP-N-acetylglucosamine 1-carboxyvinyltransferase n=1 Tax=Aeribacillus alveayuensis TaxID=279215 RepID=UPI000698A66B|nr:UDP-N-acetylglucosamine 1-carboxyvinyltransferase [Bacillus alveayuensis]